jgi:hypothetical protein
MLVAIPAKTVSPKAIHTLPISLTCPANTYWAIARVRSADCQAAFNPHIPC